MNMAGLTAEDELVVLLARPHRSEVDEARCQSLLLEEISWPAVVTRATAHGVLPVLARNLEGSGFAGVPTPVVAELWASYRVNAAHNVMLADELRRVLGVLGQARVPVIPLKGVALAESLYGDIALRVCSDLDILVPRSMVRPALEVLRTMDYLVEFGEFIDLQLRHDIECGLVRSNGVTHVLDLHWGIAWGGSKDEAAADKLWSDAYPTCFQGVSAFGLSPEWAVLFMALHAARHRWQGLKWLVDIHETCVGGGINWKSVWDTAARFGWTEPLRITLLVSHALLGTPLPDDFCPEPLPPWLALLPEDPLAPADWRGALLPARILRRPSQKLRYLAHLLLAPTPAEYRFLRLPRDLGLLYYALRPLRLGGKYGWRAARAGLNVIRGARAR
jgi:hypothetical protein